MSFNFWYLAELGAIADTSKQHWGLSAFLTCLVLFTAWLSVQSFRKFQENRFSPVIYWSTVVSLWGSVGLLFTPDLKPTLGLLLPPLMLISARRFPTQIVGAAVLITACLINQAFVDDALYGTKRSISGPTPIFCVLGLTYVWLLQIWQARKMIRGMSNPVPTSGRTSWRQSLAQWPSIRPATRTFRMALFGITATSLAINLHDLGGVSIPTSIYHPSEAVQITWNDHTAISEIRLFSRAYKNTMIVTCGSGESTFPIGNTNYLAWSHYKLKSPCRSPITITLTPEPKQSLSEMRLLSDSGRIQEPAEVCDRTACVPAPTHPLFDEPTIASSRYYFNNTFFDEIYYARNTDYLAAGQSPYENTHPPLWKLLVAGINHFTGNLPLYWRLPNAICGSFIPLLIGLLAFALTGRERLAIIAALFALLDPARITLSRIYTIDAPATFFVLAAYYFSVLRIRELLIAAAGAKPKHFSRNAILTATMLGIGLSIKWLSLFTIGGIMLLWSLAWWLAITQRANGWRDYRNAGGEIVLLTLGVPLAIYLCQFPLFFFILEDGYSWKRIFSDNFAMFNYHSGLKATHGFSAPFYTWPFLQRPTWLHRSTHFQNYSTIVVIGNPAISWLLAPAIIYGFSTRALRSRAAFLIVAIMAGMQYLPWMMSSRVTFQYHFLGPGLLAGILLAMAIERYRLLTATVLAMTMACFVMFWPVFTGANTTESYVKESLRWFSSWVF